MRRGTSYTCRECGYQSARWFGRCPSCGEFGTLEEEVVEQTTRSKKAPPAKLKPITEAKIKQSTRLKTGIEEFDRVLGGGLVPGAVILLSGHPGIGKSTLLLQVANSLAREQPVVYATGEESFEQVSMRARRLGVDKENIYLSAENDIESVLAAVEGMKPALLIADSVQALYRGSIDSSPGTVTQVREVAHLLVEYAKSKGVPVIIVGHVTKEGSIAGPKILEHVVDTVLYFEGDSTHFYRIVRAIKNRFGPVDEVGVFEMTDRGLQPVQNASAVFIGDNFGDSAVIYPALEGTRVILSEVQSIVSQSVYVNPRRTASGIDSTKLALLIAVLENRANLSFAGCDVYLSTSGGLQVREPGIDLAAAISLYSSLTTKPTGAIGAFGEIGLNGIVRPVFQPEVRIKELERFGIEKVILPVYDRINYKPENIEIVQVRNINEALEAAQ